MFNPKTKQEAIELFKKDLKERYDKISEKDRTFILI